MPLKEKLDQILKNELKDGDTDLEELDNGHICGHVISSEFNGLDYEQRRKRIRKIIEASVSSGLLSQEQVLRISTLLTYTPQEWSVASTE